MAAIEMFESFLAALPQKDRETLNDIIRYQREDLLAARSEEARVRSVTEFIKEAHDRLQPIRR